MKRESLSQQIVPVLIIFISAFFLRFFAFTFLKDNYFFFSHPSTDVTYFENWAKETASGRWLGDKTFYGLPLFAYFLAVLYRLMLFQFHVIPFILITIGAVNCVLTFCIAQKLFSRPTAWLSAFYTIISFTLIHYDTISLPITLAIFFNLSILWLLLNQSHIIKTYEWIILGILIGLGALIDGKILIFTGLFLFYEMFSYKFSSQWIKKRLLIVLGIFLIIFSVGLRNKIVGGSWVWITAQSGLSFFAGNNPTATGVYAHPSFMRPDHQSQDEDQIMIAEQLSGKKLNDKEVSQFWFNQGLNFIKQNPIQFLKLLKNKFICFFQDNEDAWDIDLLLERNWKYRWDLNPFWITCPLALLGILYSLTQKKRDHMYPYLLLFSQLIFTMIYFLTNRHRTVVLPIFIVYEVFFISWLIEQLKEKRWSYFFSAVLLIFLIFQISPRYKPLNPQDWQFLYASKSAPVYVSKGDYQTAEKMYQQALSIQPNDTNTLYNLGSLYTSEKKYDQAISIFENILKTQPFQVDTLYNLAHCLKETGNTPKALHLFEQVSQLQPQAIDSQIEILQIYLKDNNCSMAQRYADQIIKMKPRLKPEIQKLLQYCQLISDQALK